MVDYLSFIQFQKFSRKKDHAFPASEIHKNQNLSKDSLHSSSYDTFEFNLKELTLEITKKCPLRCLHCSSNGGDPFSHELPLGSWKRIIDDATKLGVKTVILSGGEPFETPLLYSICHYLVKKKLNIHVYTSGNIRRGKLLTIGRDRLLLLKNVPVNKMMVSIYAPDSVIHDRITGVPGSFNNTITTIKDAVRVGLETELHFVPMKFNWSSIQDIMSLAVRLGVNCVSVLRFVPQGRGKINQNFLELESRELLAFKNVLGESKYEYGSKLRIGTPFNALIPQGYAFCTAGLNRATISADGRVSPCEAMKELAYNFPDNDISNLSFKEIWEKSLFFQKVRKFKEMISKSPCAECNRFLECRGGCPAQRLASPVSLEDNVDPICMIKAIQRV